MKRDERLAETETNSVRSAFYNMTKQPMKLGGEISEQQIKNKLLNTMIKLVEYGSGFSNVDKKDLHIEVTSLKPTVLVKVRGKYKLEWSYEGDRRGRDKRIIEFETKRAMKISTFLINHVYDKKVEWYKHLLDEQGALAEYIAREDEAKRRWLESQIGELERFLQSEIKDISNKIKSQVDGYWVYFTTTQIHKHYIEMKESENLTSCMSKSEEYFGSRFGSSYIHPLMGYEYAPDYRLGLISHKSPEEIKKSTEYPFIGRVMVFPHAASYIGIAYARYYGNEAAGSIFVDKVPCFEKVEGLELFGMVCNKLNPSDADNATDDLMCEYQAGNAEYHLVAPFIDVWNNCLHFAEDGEIITREDGKSVVRLVTGCLARNSSEEGWGDDYLSIYYGSGVLQNAVKERDEVWSLYYKDGAWNDC